MSRTSRNHSMQITIEPNGWQPIYRARCSDPSADCHYYCAEGCETWDQIERNEAGHVLWHVYDEGAEPVHHHMTHTVECNYIAFLNESDCADELMVGKPVQFDIPAQFMFDGCDEVTWKAVP